MILLQDQLLRNSYSAFEKIANPILVILLVVLLSGIYFIYSYFSKVIAEYKRSVEEKDKRIQEQHNLLVDVRTSDAKLIAEFKNTLEKFIDSDKEYSSRLNINNELLQQLLVKVDIILKISGK
jgi:hypothetical protein